MTRAYWDALPAETQAALVEPYCIEGDGNLRAFGSPWCREHILARQREWNPHATD